MDRVPSARDQWLLEAALSGPERAVPAFSRWLAATDLDADLGWDVVRLFPLVFQNLRAQGVDHPVLGRFKGVYRRAWYESQQVMHRTAPAAACLQAQGIEPLVLDDAALALAGYDKPALRPVIRLDLLVPRSEVQAAVLVLKRAGWRSGSDGTRDDLRFADYLRFWLPASPEAELRLRWEVLPGSRERSDGRSDLRGGPLPGWPGAPVGFLHPTLQLLRIVVRRHRPSDSPSFHWVADALHLLRSQGSTIDWSSLQSAAAAHRVTGLLASGSRYLLATFGAAIPAAVQAELERHRAPVMERVADAALRFWGADREADPPPGSLGTELVRYVERKRRVGNPVRAILEFSHLLRYRWRLDGRRDILPVLLRGGANRVSLGRQF